MSVIVVLGSSGFSGRHFGAFVKLNGLDQQYEFVGIDVRVDEVSTHWLSRFVPVQENILSTIEEVISQTQPEYIVNFIGKFDGQDYSDFMFHNVEVPRAILEQGRFHNLRLKKILLIGSAAEYGMTEKSPLTEDDKVSPVSLYGLSKVFQGELASYYSRVHGVPVVIARTFNLLGKGLSRSLAVGNFEYQIDNTADGGVLSVGNLATERDYIKIEDACSEYWQILTRGHSGETYNVCSGTPTALAEILNQMIENSGKKLTIRVDRALLRKNDVPSIYGSRSKYENLILGSEQLVI